MHRISNPNDEAGTGTCSTCGEGARIRSWIKGDTIRRRCRGSDDWKTRVQAGEQDVVPGEARTPVAQFIQGDLAGMGGAACKGQSDPRFCADDWIDYIALPLPYCAPCPARTERPNNGPAIGGRGVFGGDHNTPRPEPHSPV